MLKLLAALTLFALVAPSVRAEESKAEHKSTEPTYEVLAPAKLEPATRYSGRTPIDLNNGIPFNNGTFGMGNANYEKWASAPAVVPGVSELNYPYGDRADFIGGCEESANFVENAIFNWKLPPSAITKPEAKAYGDLAAGTMQPLLDKFNESIRVAKSAGRGDWEKAQSDARHALGEMRATYSSLHKNVR